jgi:hypothetical protein
MDISVDTLRLQIAGMDAIAARRFARLVAERLAATMPEETTEPSQRLGSLSVSHQARLGDSPDNLAVATAGDISRAVRSAGLRTGRG